MDKCQCEKAGFCEYYNKEMTSSPPNWQWCQGATASERIKHKRNTEKNKRLRSRGVIKMVTHQDLVNACLERLLPKLQRENIGGIVAIPRSGYIPASICATSIGVPIYNIVDKKLIPAKTRSEFGGKRMEAFKYDPLKKLVFMDDTICTGDALEEIKKDFPEMFTACVFASNQAKEKVDIYAEILPIPHILEWHFFNSLFVGNTLFDLDGIFAPEVPIEVCQEEAAYIDFIENCEPIYRRIPSLYRCKAIVTGRLEKYRSITERWLSKHKIPFDDLIMFPTEDEEKRNSNHIVEVAKYKSIQYMRLGAGYFMESSIHEANNIYTATNKNVICPEA